jgi:uncharacterized membrane protein
MSEDRIVRERRLLNLWILRGGIALCVLFSVAGLGVFFARGGTNDSVALSGSLRDILRETVQGSIGLHAGALLHAGLIVLLLTPLARLAAGIYVSARARDGLYAIIGLLVLALVLVGIVAGQSA